MSGLPARHARALEALLEAFTDIDRPWALTGSTSFALQGVSIDPDDIDIQTDRHAASQMSDILNDHCIEPLSYRSSPAIRSWLGRFEIEGVEVEIIGNIERRGDGGWVGPVAIEDHRMTVPWRGYTVPVLDLEYEAEAYAQLGRSDRAELLRDHID